MRRFFTYFLVGVLALLCGVVLGLKVSEKDHWKAIKEYRRWVENPESYEPAGPPGLLVSHDEPPDIGPSLAALEAKGELTHVDLVFPNVPSSREVTRYWMEQCQEIDGLVEATANPEYVEFKTSGLQPFHMNLWFTDEASEQVKELIAEIESFARDHSSHAPASDAQQTAPPWIEPGHPAPADIFARLVDESGAASVTNLQGFGATWQGYQAWLRFGAGDEYIDALIAKGFERVEWSAIGYRFELPPDYGHAFEPPWDPAAVSKKECYEARVTNDWTHSGEHYIVIDRASGTVYFVGLGA